MDERLLILEGLLLKSPPEEKIKKNYKWHKRYFRLWTDCTLEYFKKQEDKAPVKEPIDLNTCLGIIDTDPKYEKHFTKPFKYPFCLNMQHRQYHFVAVTEHERDQWRRAIADICGLGERMNRTQEEVQQILNNELPRRPSVSSARTVRSSSQLSATSTPTSCRTSSSASNTQGELPVQPTASPILSKVNRPEIFNNAAAIEPVFLDSSVLPRRTSLPENRGFLDVVELSDSPYDQLPPPVPIANLIQPKNQQSRKERPEYLDIVLNKKSSFDDYDTPHVNNEATYDTPTVISTVNSLKQNRTNSPCESTNDSGYIQMEGENNILTGKIDFFPNNNRPIMRVESEKDTHFKQFRTVGRQNPKSQSLKPKMKSKPEPLLPHKHSTIIGLPSLDDGPVFDEIPVMPSKHVKEIVNTNGLDSPPQVDRCKKPVKPVSPQVDRSTKPMLRKQLSENSVRRKSDEDLHQPLLNMSFDSSHFASHRQQYDSNDVYTNHTFNTHKHINNNNTKAVSMTTDIFESEGDYCNHRINNAPVHRGGFTSPFRRGDSSENLDPMGDYDNFKLQKSQQQLPINMKKFFKPPLQRQFNATRSFDDNFYDSIRPNYEREELPETPSYCSPTTKRRSFSLDTDYTNFAPLHDATRNNATNNESYVNSHPSEEMNHHANVTVSPSRLGTHYVVTPTTFSEA